MGWGQCSSLSLRRNAGKGIGYGVIHTLTELDLDSIWLEGQYPPGHAGGEFEVSADELAQGGVVGPPGELDGEMGDGLHEGEEFALVG